MIGRAKGLRERICNVQETLLKPQSTIGSGRVRRFDAPGKNLRVTQITTFCPDVIGPGATHLYLIEGSAIILLDAGIPTHLAQAFFYQWRNQPMPAEVQELASDHTLQEFFQGLELAGRSVGDIDLVVISHGHPDHFLMLQSILDGANPAIAAHILDTPEICNPWGLLSMWLSRQEQLQATGMPSAWSPRPAVRDELFRNLNLESMGVAVRVDTPIFDNGPVRLRGATLSGVEAIHLPGHTPGSIGLILGEGDDRMLLCGDVLLNPITPHPDNLLVYLRTLRVLGQLDGIGLVLPAHGEEIRDLKARVQFLQEHHRQRLNLTYEACASPRSVWEIATRDGYFDTYVNPAKFNPLAALEALVHMELLNMVDGLHRCDMRNDVHYFKNSGEPFDRVYGRIADLIEGRNSGAMMRY